MNKIIDIQTAIDISGALKKQHRKTVVTGGCFDILHIGHIKLLKASKKQGGILFVFLESDENVKKLKDKGRPINSQRQRAEVLSALSCVDYVIELPVMKSDEDYDNLIRALKPDIITTTKNDPQGIHNERQAKKINAKVMYVTDKITNKSTTRLAEIISKNFEK